MNAQWPDQSQNVHLVLLHGWGLNAEVWRCIDEELSSRLYCTIDLQLRNRDLVLSLADGRNHRAATDFDKTI